MNSRRLALYAATLTTLAFGASGCRVIGDIFKAGVGVGVAIVVVLVAVIGGIAMLAKK